MIKIVLMIGMAGAPRYCGMHDSCRLHYYTLQLTHLTEMHNKFVEHQEAGGSAFSRKQNYKSWRELNRITILRLRS